MKNKKIVKKQDYRRDTSNKYPNKDNYIGTNKYLITGLIGTLTTLAGFALDKLVIKLINTITYPFLIYIFIIITTLGEPYIILLLSLILTISIFMYRKPIIAFILALSTAFFIQWILKTLIHRQRPFEIGLTNTDITTISSSFPSGHTMMFFVLIPIIGQKLPRIKPLFWTLAVLVGFSRVYLGVHYLSDVIAGAFMGYIIGWTFMDIESRYGWKI